MKYFLYSVGSILLIFLFLGLISWTVMSLWNFLMPQIFGLMSITFCQAGGLFLLSRILFGGLGFGRGAYWQHKKHNWKDKMNDKWNNMSEDERSEWRERFNQYCGSSKEHQEK